MKGKHFTKTQVIVTIIGIAVVVTAAAVFLGRPNIVGTWEMYQTRHGDEDIYIAPDSRQLLVFRSDGTATIIGAHGFPDIDFTWSINGNNLTQTFVNERGDVSHNLIPITLSRSRFTMYTEGATVFFRRK